MKLARCSALKTEPTRTAIEYKFSVSHPRRPGAIKVCRILQVIFVEVLRADVSFRKLLQIF